MRSLALTLTLIISSPVLHAQATAGWRTATASELESVLPARAQVGKERIETEMRTASGIINKQGKVFAGVVLITAGYSAEGKYSHYILLQSPVLIGDTVLQPGSYALGWSRVPDGLQIHIDDAESGTQKVSVTAHPAPAGIPVEAFRIRPPNGRSTLQIGRFELPYSLRVP
jgi:hypothetical protein